MPAACPELETYDSPEPVRFGEILRTHRRAAGMTQEELAERAGVSPRSISGLERGEGATPRRVTVSQLIRALGLEGADRAEFQAMVARRRPPGPRLLSDGAMLGSIRSDVEARHNLTRSLNSFVG